MHNHKAPCPKQQQAPILVKLLTPDQLIHSPKRPHLPSSSLHSTQLLCPSQRTHPRCPLSHSRASSRPRKLPQAPQQLLAQTPNVQQKFTPLLCPTSRQAEPTSTHMLPRSHYQQAKQSLLRTLTNPSNHHETHIITPAASSDIPPHQQQRSAAPPPHTSPRQPRKDNSQLQPAQHCQIPISFAHHPLATTSTFLNYQPTCSASPANSPCINQTQRFHLWAEFNTLG